MFGGGFNDPFFGDMNRHFAQMQQMMMADFMDPFQQQRSQQQQQQRSLQGSRVSNNSTPSQQQQQQVMRRQADPFAMMMSNPFSLMNSMMGGNMFGNMEQMIQSTANNPNAHVYSSSTVTSYSNNGQGAPRVYQATSETKQLPGGIKETRKAVRDSERGIEKMAIGHHIGDKAHVIERQRKRDGEVEEVVNYENLDENEINEFNQEFEQKINNPNRLNAIGQRSARSSNHHSHHNANYNHPLSIEDGHQRREKKRSKQAKH